MTTESTQPRFSIFDEIDRGLTSLVNGVFQHESGRSRETTPALVVYELEDHYCVECDLPGVTLEAIDLKVNDGVLEISGHRKPVQADGAKVTLNERPFGDFSRKLKLSDGIQVENISAELGSGVLKVIVPKAVVAVPRKIAIRRAEDSQSS